MRRLKYCGAAVGVLLLLGCDDPEPLLLKAGPHVIAVADLPEWEHLDYGDRHHFRRGFAILTLEDLDVPALGLDYAAASTLTRFREDERRDIASRDSVRVDGRTALAIDTWDRYSHEFRRRYVVVENRRHYLVLGTLQGSFAETAPAFDALLASLTFADSPADSGAPGDGNRRQVQ